MSFRLPGQISPTALETSLDVIGQEILAEKAAALGRAGERAEKSLRALRDHSGDDAQRDKVLKEAADAVYSYFIQRELCGFRKHDSIIREYSIPKQVLVRLGAK